MNRYRYPRSNANQLTDSRLTGMYFMNFNHRKRTSLASIVFLAALACATSSKASDQIPGAPQKEPIALRGGVIHTVSGETYERGSLLFENGKITRVWETAEIETPTGTRIIELEGKHVYPSLIESNSSIGLVEIESIQATIDTTETGQINSNVRAQVAFNPDSEAIPVARANGVLLAASVPSGGLIGGRGSLMQLDGWSWEDMTVKSDVVMQLAWPRFGAPRFGRRGGGPPQAAASATDRVKELADLLEKTRAYALSRANDPDRTPLDRRLENLIPVIHGELPFLIDADDVQQIESAVAFCRKQQVQLVIFGGYEALSCATLLKEANVPIIVAGTYRLPQNRHDPYDSAYSLPARLREAGIKYCISGAGRFSASNLRNLPYHAAAAVAFGLDPQEALRAITLYPAEILKVADRVGSLEPGKDATLFIADGDVLDTPTQVVQAFIQGRQVDLSSKHTQLYEKYRTKYERLMNE